MTIKIIRFTKDLKEKPDRMGQDNRYTYTRDSRYPERSMFTLKKFNRHSDDGDAYACSVTTDKTKAERSKFLVLKRKY